MIIATKKNEYYVYALIDPRDNSIFYIGKGKGKRSSFHVIEVKALDKKNIYSERSTNPSKIEKIKNILDSGFEVACKVIAENLSEESAYALEEILVERFGRQVLRTGNLTNLEPGGKWDYPKLILEENEKTTIKDVYEKFPELIEILETYPHIAHEPLPIKVKPLTAKFLELHEKYQQFIWKES